LIAVLFNSLGFLALFALFVPLYYAASHRHRRVLLVAASLLFYAALRIEYLALLSGVAVVAYVAARAIAADRSARSRKIWLASAVACVLALLAATKFLPAPGIAGAAGVSFYTFSAISYLVDVHRGVLPAERYAGHLLLYLAFFPKLLAGPIERARPFLRQARTPVSFNAAGVTSGLQLMLWGLFKKVVIADRLATFVDSAYGQPSFAPPADLVIATYFFAFQLYCDFSGYSDMAIGAAKVLGFDLMDNFRRPYLSTSVPEFWSRRWHFSLASWFRDYMYIPMGGNRVGPLRRALNVMAVFLASGLWHGANWTFLIWGGLNGAFTLASTAASPALVRAWPAGGIGGRGRPYPMAAVNLLLAALTFHLILVSWVFFRAESVADAATIFSRVTAASPSLPGLLRVRLASGSVVLSLALIAVLLAVEYADEKRPLWERLRVRPLVFRWAVYYALLIALIVLGTWNAREFVYMQF
jgi:D-alanyl-lipoteichoic acid acyltransferase DltB (MBOAT superfamily)